MTCRENRRLVSRTDKISLTDHNIDAKKRFERCSLTCTLWIRDQAAKYKHSTQRLNSTSFFITTLSVVWSDQVNVLQPRRDFANFYNLLDHWSRMQVEWWVVPVAILHSKIQYLLCAVVGMIGWCLLVVMVRLVLSGDKHQWNCNPNNSTLYNAVDKKFWSTESPICARKTKRAHFLFYIFLEVAVFTIIYQVTCYLLRSLIIR
jgi:hypothetical protein